ncbi:MAG: O-antigen ligase family protein [Ignavibacteriaceae bacterium]|nr:O-antigen ligase family protein [Ignavibacteriaceae bacterium]
MKQEKFRTAIVFFVVLFLLTLTNSIFLNQIGYFGALIVLLVQFAVKKENPFQKTELEIPFLLFLAVEFIAFLLSDFQANAFQNFLKRGLLIPVIYVFASVPETEKDVKRITVIYVLAASVVTTLYIYRSLEYFIQNLYRTTESGPSIFQYPITSSELYSFLVILLFAFVLYGKLNLKIRIAVIILFLIAAASLFATYKMTGWIGAAAGMGVVLFYKRDWKLIVPALILIGVLFVVDKNVSRVEVYRIQNGTFTKTAETETEGRPYDLLTADGSVLLSNFQGGLVTVTEKAALTKNFRTPSPVVTIREIDSIKLLLWMMDSRFWVVSRTSESYELLYEVLSPGQTNAFTLSDSLLYIMDKDSGLSVFRLSDDSFERIFYNKDFPFAQRLSVVNSLLFHHAVLTGLQIHRLERGVPVAQIYHDSNMINVSLLAVRGDELIISSNGETVRQRFDDSAKTFIKSGVYTEAGQCGYFATDGGSELFIQQGGKILVYSDSGNSPPKSIVLPYSPNSAAVKGDAVFVTQMKRSRMLRITDPYHLSNYARFEMWKTGWRIFQDHPWFGVGDISLEPYYKAKKSPYLKEIQGHLHNNYVHILAILGGTGFVVFIYMLGLVFLRLHRSVAALKGHDFFYPLTLGVIGAFTGFLVSGLTEWNFGDHEIITMVWFFVGLVVAAERIVLKTNRS